LNEKNTAQPLELDYWYKLFLWANYLQWIKII